MSTQSDAAEKIMDGVVASLEVTEKYAAEVKDYAGKFKDAALGMFDAVADKLNNPPSEMGPAFAVECIKELAPMDVIIGGLKNGGVVFVRWGTPKDIVNSRLLRVIKVEDTCIIARPIELSATKPWSEGKDTEFGDPKKYILKIFLIQKS